DRRTDDEHSDDAGDADHQRVAQTNQRSNQEVAPQLISAEEMRPDPSFHRKRRSELHAYVKFGRREPEDRRRKDRQEDDADEDHRTDPELGGSGRVKEDVCPETAGFRRLALGELDDRLLRHQYCSLLSIVVEAKSTRMFTSTS